MKGNRNLVGKRGEGRKNIDSNRKRKRKEPIRTVWSDGGIELQLL